MIKRTATKNLTPLLRSVVAPKSVVTPILSSRLSTTTTTSTPSSLSTSSIRMFSSSPSINNSSKAAKAAEHAADVPPVSKITTSGPAPIVDFEYVKSLATNPVPNTYLIDVREPSEYAQGYIPTALNIPYKSSPGALGLDEEEFSELFGFPKPPTDGTLVFYCLGGVRSTAAEILADTFGYQKRMNYTGSYKDWIEHDGPVEYPKKEQEASEEAAATKEEPKEESK